MHVDITDLEIVDYIQRDPTISLKEISKEIGLSESTVQRRWRRLTGEGLAWTGAALHPSASAGLFIKFSVQESHLASLLYKNDLVTVGRLPGVNRYFGLIIRDDLEKALLGLQDNYPELRDAEDLTVYPFVAIGGGVTWKQEIIDHPGPNTPLPLPLEGTPPPHRSFSPLDKKVFSALSKDARASIREIAAVVGTSSSSVQRSRDRLLDDRVMVFRCDVARRKFDYKFSIVVSMRASQDSARALVRELSEWSESRFCAEVISANNVVAVFGVRDAHLIGDLLSRIEKTHPTARIMDYEICSGMEKAYGWVLDRRGHQIGHVTPQPW